MTEYDRTPIEVADMRNGDLIAMDDHWTDEDAETFVAVHPLDDGAIVTALEPGSAEVWPAARKTRWFKLTPKPEPVVCVHCGEEIHRTDLGWRHVDSRSSSCKPRIATPATESETA